MAAPLECLHQAQLLLRSHPGKHVGPFGLSSQVIIGERLDLKPGQGLRTDIRHAGQGELAGDGHGGFGMVPGNHFHLNSGIATRFHGLDRFRAGRIDHA